MEKALVLLLVTLAAVAYAAPGPRGLFVNLDDGEICMNSMQCKSKCCQHDTILGIARCTHQAMENSECSPKTIYGIYYRCPCERGLTCEGDKTILGAITNTNYGICLDVGRSKQ
ncbi:colipase isoform X1 [Cricetulus griseus]|uniref:Colipase n=1 Tax=Cricetulus griseus TaxID=10029 RepID=G3HZU4_CRIGR|nr:colipase isoform X1 [Cricetulus griseus]XP_027244758.1 colipase isoform X1 [Cricetulus griseus]EGW03619.1 Colipase [Cricetulus griseus]